MIDLRGELEARVIADRIEPRMRRPQQCVRTVSQESKQAEQPLLEVRDLTIRFRTRRGWVDAVNGLSYSLPHGRSLAIVGESGAGKTASARALIGLLSRNAVVNGSARLRGTELLGLREDDLRSYRGAQIAMVFQDSDTALNPTMRVGSQIAEAIRLHTGAGRRAAWDQAVELLRSLKMSDPEYRVHLYPHELSGGMRQRVMLAIALAGNPKLLIADESTRALDGPTQAEVVRLLGVLRRRLEMSVILITHDLRLACNFADCTLVMYAGYAMEYGPTKELFDRPRTPYTRALVTSIPKDAPQLVRVSVCADEAVDSTRAPTLGCPFEPRCPSATTVCRQERPPLVEHERDHYWACWNA